MRKELKDIGLNKEQFETLVYRFDVFDKNGEFLPGVLEFCKDSVNDSILISRSCICSEFYSCLECPFRAGRRVWQCGKFIKNKINRGRSLKYLYLQRSYYSFDRVCEEEAKVEIVKIRDWLKGD